LWRLLFAKGSQLRIFQFRETNAALVELPLVSLCGQESRQYPTLF